MKNELEIKVALQISKPAHVVFEAIVDPEKMTRYFISKSSGRMETGKELQWEFPEFDLQVPVRVDQINKDRYISFYWDDVDGKPLLVEINLIPQNETSTLVEITEKSKEYNESGVEWLRRNTEGWANFLACLKAWTEYQINLRKGAFDFMSEK